MTEDICYRAVYSGDCIRLDKALSSLFIDFSRTKLQQAIKKGEIEVDGQIISNPSFKIINNSAIKLSFKQNKAIEIITKVNKYQFFFVT